MKIEKKKIVNIDMRMKKSILLLILSITLNCFCICSMVAQNEQNDHILIRGMILEKIPMKPIPFATIQVLCYPKDSCARVDTLHQVADDAGRFEISLPIVDKYLFSSSAMGMTSIDCTLRYEQLKKTGLIKLEMQESTENLDEVTITATRPLVRVAIDRLIYNADQDPISRTSNLSDMLRRVPLVTVDGEGNIQVKGSKNFQIFINGKPSRIMSSNPKEILKSIAASSIKKIEVITNPGVEYDAEGSSIILNFVMNQSLDFKGVQGTVTLTGGFPGMLSTNANLTAATDKLSATANYSFSTYKRTAKYGTQTEEDSYVGDTYSHSLVTHSLTKYQMHNASLYLNYQIAPKHLLTTNLNFTQFASPSNYEEEGHTYAFLDGNQGNELFGSLLDGRMKTLDRSLNLNTDYQISFDRPEETLTFSYMYDNTANNQEYNEKIQQNIFSPEKNHIPMQQERFSRSKTNEHTAQIDYVLPFKEIHKLVVGTKGIVRLGNTNPKVNSYDLSSTQMSSVPSGVQSASLSNSSMQFTQKLLALYTAYYLTMERFSMQVGTRVEYGKYHVEYPEYKHASFAYKFLDFVPQIGAAFNISPVTKLSLLYNMHVKRPSMDQLNPFVLTFGQYLQHFGNPELRNERIHNIDLGFSHFTQKFNVALNIVGEYTDHPIVRRLFADTSQPQIRKQTFENAGYRLSIGLNGYLNYRPFSWLNLTMNSNLARIVLDAGIPEYKGKVYGHRSGWNGNLYLMAAVNLPKKWQCSIYGGMFSYLSSLNMSAMDGLYHGLTVAKSFMQDKLNISFSLNNPFTPVLKLKMESEGPNYHSTSMVSSYMFNAAFTISYRFGQMKSNNIGTISRTIVNDDLSSLSGKNETTPK